MAAALRRARRSCSRSWLVEVKQGVIENMAPVLTRLFTPLFTPASRVPGDDDLDEPRDRHPAGGSDRLRSAARRRPRSPAVLRLRAGSARAPRPLRSAPAHPRRERAHRRRGRLSAIAARISDFGFTPNRTAALGENLILLVNLAWSPCSTRASCEVAAVQRSRAVADGLPAGLRRVGGDRRDRLPAAVRIHLTGRGPVASALSLRRRRRPPAGAGRRGRSSCHS